MSMQTERTTPEAQMIEQPAPSSAQVDLAGHIPLSQIRISALNPRKNYTGDIKSLIQSIEAGGGSPLQPILIRRTPDANYEVIAGGRRFTVLLQIRGRDGFLHAGEFRLVDWSDDKCIRAGIDENLEREDLSPIDEGRFLNSLADHLTSRGETVTDEILESKTGLDRPRISDRRALAEKFDLLPKSWRDQLSAPANRRSGDKQEISITATHFKYARKFIKPKIDPHVLKIMDRAAEDGWSAAKFKTAIDALKTPASDEKAGADESKERDADGTPDYERVLRGLKAAHRGTGKDDKIAEAIVGIIKLVEILIKDERDRAKAAEAAKATQPESEPVGTVAN